MNDIEKWLADQSTDQLVHYGNSKENSDQIHPSGKYVILAIEPRFSLGCNNVHDKYEHFHNYVFDKYNIIYSSPICGIYRTTAHDL